MFRDQVKKALKETAKFNAGSINKVPKEFEQLIYILESAERFSSVNADDSLMQKVSTAANQLIHNSEDLTFVMAKKKSPSITNNNKYAWPNDDDDSLSESSDGLEDLTLRCSKTKKRELDEDLFHETEPVV